jgi:hypothetical protein
MPTDNTSAGLVVLAMVRAALKGNWEEVNFLFRTAEDPGAILGGILSHDVSTLRQIAMMLDADPEELLDRGVACLVDRAAK